MRKWSYTYIWGKFIVDYQHFISFFSICEGPLIYKLINFLLFTVHLRSLLLMRGWHEVTKWRAFRLNQQGLADFKRVVSLFYYTSNVPWDLSLKMFKEVSYGGVWEICSNLPPIVEAKTNVRCVTTKPWCLMSLYFVGC